MRTGRRSSAGAYDSVIGVAKGEVDPKGAREQGHRPDLQAPLMPSASRIHDRLLHPAA